jgi:hypothetical protein
MRYVFATILLRLFLNECPICVMLSLSRQVRLGYSGAGERNMNIYEVLPKTSWYLAAHRAWLASQSLILFYPLNGQMKKHY